MLKRLRALWCQHRGHRFHVVARLYSGAEGEAREVQVEVCPICGARRDRPPSTGTLTDLPSLDEQARLKFLARARRRALRRAARERR